MDVKITLWDKGYPLENVFNKSFSDYGKSIVTINQWLQKKDFSKSVFVCFENHGGLNMENLRDEQKSILVSHDFIDISLFVEQMLEIVFETNPKKTSIAIMEFESYAEAFDYCIDLKESF